MPEVRATQDVDVIVEVASRMEYYRLEEELRRRGFKQDMSENAPVCRWLVDIITILDGRPEIVSEIRSSSDDLKDFLSRTFRTLLANNEFRESIPGHLSPDRASQSRLPLLIKRLGEIAEMSD